MNGRRSDYSGAGGRAGGNFRRILFTLLVVVVAGLLYFRNQSLQGPAEQARDKSAEATRQPSWPPSPERAAVDGTEGPEVVDVPVVISRGFRPVGYRMAAVSHLLPLSERPPAGVSALPPFTGIRQRYCKLALSGVSIDLALDADRDGYKLYVDGNGNGDLTDDGAPLTNQGTGVFAATLGLPLSRVTGQAWLKGDYQLWIFAGTREWPPASLSYYAKTQLSGPVQLPQGTFTVYLADNRKLDGDYTNDGVSIDLNRDGRIELREEHVPPGGHILIDGVGYRFSVEY